VLSLELGATWHPEEELRAEIERLRAENENLKKAAAARRHVAESQREGALVYGLGRFPVTPIASSEKLLGMSDRFVSYPQKRYATQKKE